MKAKYFFLLLVLTIILSACMTSNDELHTSETEQQANQNDQNNDVSDLNWQIPDFTAKDHNDQPYTKEQMTTDISLVNMIFTRCNDVCPPMTSNMAKVQQELKKQQINDIQLISFTADPDHDQPDILTQFATQHQADLSNWSFLTGYTEEDVDAIALEAFKSNVSREEGPTQEVPILINHPTYFYLVNQEGKILKFYDGLQPDPTEIANDIKELQAN